MVPGILKLSSDLASRYFLQDGRDIKTSERKSTENNIDFMALIFLDLKFSP